MCYVLLNLLVILLLVKALIFFKSTVKLLFQAHKILNVSSKRHVEISTSTDSTILTSSLVVVDTGTKLINISCADPISADHASKQS